MGEGSKASEADPSEERLERSTTAERRVDDSNGDLQVDMGAKMADDSTETLCNGAEQATQGLLDVPSADEGSKKSGSDDRKSEDLFLNIAKTDAGGEQALTRSEMRKVCLFFFSPFYT